MRQTGSTPIFQCIYEQTVPICKMIACPGVEPSRKTRSFIPPSEIIKAKKKKAPPASKCNTEPALATKTNQNVAFAAGASGGGGGLLPSPLLTQMKVQVQRRGGGRILAYTIIWRV